jgi:hypothetical protein
MQRAYALLPHVKITELLLEVDEWTAFASWKMNLTHEEGKTLSGPGFSPNLSPLSVLVRPAPLARLHPPIKI